jgi:hypothetical protein
VRGGPRRDAGGHGRARRGPRQDQPPAACGAGHRPLRPGGRLRLPRRHPHQPRPGIRAQPRAVPVPQVGPEGAPQLPRRAAEHRHRAPGQPGVPGPRGVPERGDRRGLPGHSGGHRLPHHDDQRPGRAGLGRRRHRGRGGDARAAGEHAAAAGGRLPPEGAPGAGRDGHRPGAHRHRDAAQEGRGREVRGVLRRGPRRPEPGRPRYDRQHGPGVRRDLRLLPGGPVSSSRPTSASSTSSGRKPSPRPSTATSWSSTSPPSSPASPVPSAPRTASPSRTPRPSGRRPSPPSPLPPRGRNPCPRPPRSFAPRSSSASTRSP